jgi:hydroxypyruvate reductase
VSSDRDGLRAQAVAIFDAAVNSVQPQRLVADFLRRDPGSRWRRGPILIVGAGKAAARMAAGAEEALDTTDLRGEVVVADGCGVDLHNVEVSEAGHPLPDHRGEEAAHRLLRLVERQENGHILCLISGGASSLLVAPRAPVTLADKIATTQLLLRSSADIRALNTVRKHLSEVKGGGLLRRARVDVTSLVISDVVGDDLGTIGSGPTTPDATTFADAWAVLQRYELSRRVPRHVAELLQAGMRGDVPETLKVTDPAASRGSSSILASNRTALEAAGRKASDLGWRVVVEEEALSGDTRDAALGFAVRLRTARPPSDEAGVCIIAGGETTVHVTGAGRGGRNQEFALAIVQALRGLQATVLSAGTDGIDGPTHAAGAFADGTTADRAAAKHLDPNHFLANNDSNTFFTQLGDLFAPGPTGTNVMDVKIALLDQSSAISQP